MASKLIKPEDATIDQLINDIFGYDSHFEVFIEQEKMLVYSRDGAIEFTGTGDDLKTALISFAMKWNNPKLFPTKFVFHGQIDWRGHMIKNRSEDV